MKTCPECGGSGLGECLTCHGDGCSICMVEDNPEEYAPCPECDGEGVVPITERELEEAGQLNALDP